MRGEMKKFILIILICLISFSAFAKDSFWAEAQYNIIVYDDTNIDDFGNQYKAMLGWKYFYLWAAMDSAVGVDWGGQNGPEFELTSLGFGLRIPIVNHLSAYGEAGRFMVSSQEDEVYLKGTTTPWEAMYYYGIGKTGHPPRGHFDTHQTKLSDNLGGQIGLMFDYEVWKGLTFTANAGYRYLRLERHTELRWYDTPNDYWVFEDNQDASGWVFGIGVAWLF